MIGFNDTVLKSIRIKIYSLQRYRQQSFYDFGGESIAITKQLNTKEFCQKE